jgi:6-phosphofructokinase 1|tara:strand:- start:2867 stop:3343 length:477 start_codon:yes stop_codon:yes gene_type:complete
LSQDEECNVCQFVPEFAKRAGPRAAIYHDPQTTHAAIVNCGGLCPGINDVIRSVVTTLETGYGVQKISGIRYGFGGFWKEGSANLELTRANTSGLQKSGGSVIGTGRGGGDVMKIVDSIEKQVRVAFPKSDTRCFADCPRSNYVVTTYITSARFYRSC